MYGMTLDDGWQPRDPTRAEEEFDALRPLPPAEMRVREGAAWLDAVRPLWFTEVNLSQLVLQDSCGCVLGQIVRGQRQAARTAGWDTYQIESHLGGYGAIITKERITERRDRLAEIDALSSLVMSQYTAILRGFHIDNTETGGEGFDRWNDLTRAWYAAIEDRCTGYHLARQIIRCQMGENELADFDALAPTYHHTVMA